MTTLTLDQIRDFANSHTVSPAEKRAQRVSLITGVLSEKSSLTKEKVESLLNLIEGNDTPVSAAKK